VTEDAHISCKFSKKNRGRNSPLRGNYIGKIPFFSVLGAVNFHPLIEPIKVKFGMEERTCGPLLLAKFHLDRYTASPLWGEKTPNRDVSKNNTGRAACSRILPVKRHNSVIFHICGEKPPLMILQPNLAQG